MKQDLIAGVKINIAKAANLYLFYASKERKRSLTAKTALKSHALWLPTVGKYTRTYILFYSFYGQS